MSSRWTRRWRTSLCGGRDRSGIAPRPRRITQSWGWYGLIAEELALIDPRLVHWAYQEDQYEMVEVEPEREETILIEDGAGTREIVVTVPAVMEQRVKAGEAKRPDGAQYERMVVMLLDVARRQDERLAAIETRFAEAD